jgi:hypothetical protein
MPNYKMELAENAGAQFKISKRLSLSFELGIMYSGKWYIDGEYSIRNYLSWSFNDTITGDYYEGENLS